MSKCTNSQWDRGSWVPVYHCWTQTLHRVNSWAHTHSCTPNSLKTHILAHIQSDTLTAALYYNDRFFFGGWGGGALFKNQRRRRNEEWEQRGKAKETQKSSTEHFAKMLSSLCSLVSIKTELDFRCEEDGHFPWAALWGEDTSDTWIHME